MKLPPALVTALRTLTILPVRGSEAERPADSLAWFPAVGALIGSLLWVTQKLLMTLLPATPPAVAAVAVVTAGVLLTRGLHLDGLADWADAIWGGWTPQRRLEIMKDSSLGTFGTLALVLVLLARFAAIAALIERGQPAWIILACIIARTAQVDLAACFPYARPEGGTGAAFITQASREHRRTALLTALAFTLIIGLSCLSSLNPLALALIALIAARAFGHSCKRNIGGITGDTLGAASELCETLVLLLAACT
jgi:adenosylcobinamide-GDP ribazoletransferase